MASRTFQEVDCLTGMSVQVFRTRQLLPITIQEAWEFFSSPRNLSVITPPEMNFVITTEQLPDKTYAGQMIAYKVSPLPGFRTTWVTEITHVEAPHFFVDEQRKGPYSMWHHQHRFEAVTGGVLMTDVVHYEVPLGFIGDLLNRFFIRNKIQSIFDFRTRKLEQLFPEKNR